MLLDRDGRVLFINRTAPGLTVEEAVGTSVYDHVPTTQHEAMRAAFGRVVETREQARYDNIYTSPDGQISHWESRIGPIVEGGTVGGFVLFSSNVTDRREAALERDRIFELSLDMLCVASFDGYFVRINPAFSTTLGFSDAELLAKPFLEFVHPEDRSRTQRAHDGLVNEQRTVSNFENRYITKAGEYRVIQWMATVDPGLRRVIAVGRDATERRALEEQLLHSQKMDAIGQLAGGVAHDFNNLLLSIIGNTHFAEQAANLQEALPHLDEVRVAAERAAALTKQLLTISRRQPMTTGEVDLPELLHDMLKLLRRLIPESITITDQTFVAVRPVRADRAQLEQVIMNLCLNARDAMPQGGRMAISAADLAVDSRTSHVYPWAEPGNYVVLTVHDTGTGMSPAVRERCFEPFFTTKPPGSGTGLGLATVYGIVQQHGGRLRVQSEPGKGTTFEVVLPAAMHRASVPGAETARQPAGGSETILLAEDEALVRRVVAGMLERAGYDVIVVPDGQAALQACRERDDIALAILDIVMPGLSGVEAATQMQAQRPNLPVVFISGYSAAAQAEAQPDDTVVLVKPFKAEDLLSRVRARIDARR